MSGLSQARLGWRERLAIPNNGVASSPNGHAAYISIMTFQPAAVFWALAVETPGSVSVDHHILKSMLDGKYVVGVDTVESRVVGIRIRIDPLQQDWNMVQVTLNKKIAH